jgi:kinesin family member 18/19
MAILKGGNKERTQEPTAANKTSSRSHAVLIVSVKQRQRLAGIHQQVRVGKLFLIDLAGSERAANTQNRGKRMVEGAHINRSLLALGNCINALSMYDLSTLIELLTGNVNLLVVHVHSLYVCL